MVQSRDLVDVVRVSPSALTGAVIAQATSLLRTLVAGGAALGWVEPPHAVEVEGLLREVVDASAIGDACLVAAIDSHGLIGLGYWRRYSRPTHYPHVDVEKLAVAASAQGHHLGRRIMTELLKAAREAHVEVVTLDLRADNDRAVALYESLGFERYGMLPRFVAVGSDRYDKYFYALDMRAKLFDDLPFSD